MSFFENIYRSQPTRTEDLTAVLVEPAFRYSDVLGGSVLGRTSVADGRLPSDQQMEVIKDAVSFAFYQLVALGLLKVKRVYARQTFLNNFERDTSKIILERTPAGEGQLPESPFMLAILHAASGDRSLKKVVKRVVDDYIGPGTHRRPVTTFFSAILQGEMRHWRLERHSENLGFTRYYTVNCPREHREILADAIRHGRGSLGEIAVKENALFAVLRDLIVGFEYNLLSRKHRQHRNRHHHRPHPRRGRKRKHWKPGWPGSPDDPRVWGE